MGISHLFGRLSARRSQSRRSRKSVNRHSRFERLEERKVLAVDFTGGTYTQNFDGLGSATTGTAWTNDTTLTGWHLFNKTPAALTSVVVSNGSGTGSFHNFGTTSATDRALGGVGSGGTYFGSPASGALAGWIAVSITNNTGLPASTFTVNYDGEQWRNGGNTSAQTMVAEYGFGATFAGVTAWTPLGTAFNFTSPITGAAAAALDGNASANRVAGLGGTVTPTSSWTSGSTLWIRWIENNDTGNDHGLAIDNLTFSASTAAATAPVITTPTQTSLTASGATLGGSVTSDGGATVTERGIVYAIKADNAAPEIGGAGATKVAAAAGGTGAFTVPVTGLASGTLYAFKAYATNSAGTSYTDVAEFTTGTAVVAPTVVSPTSASILDLEALLGGTVSSDGGATVTERGIVISLTSENALPEIGGTGVTTVPADTAGTGLFTKLVTGLTASSGYTFRAYAINTAGTSYSDPATFTTNAAATAPVISSPTKFFISTTATLGGNVTADGGRPVTERGIVYAKTSENGDPVIGGTGVTKVAAATAATGVFTVAASGLEALTGYTFKAYATNSVGTSYTTLDTFTTYATETSLTSGDIAFTAYQTDDPDSFSFVLLKDVVAGTTITFTDNGWAFDQSGFFATNENTQTVQFGNAYAAGTHFQIAVGVAPTPSAFAVIGSGETAGVMDGLLIGLSTSGDSILAYQGSAPTSGSATNWIAGLNSKPWATAAFTGSNDSALPSALTNGTTAIGFASEEDNGAYNKATFRGTPAQIRADVNNTANWTRLGSSGPVSLTVFTVATVATTTTLSVTPSTVNFGSSVTFSGTVTAASGTDSPVGNVEIRTGGPTGTLLAQGSVSASGSGSSSYSLSSSSVPTGTYTDVRAYFTGTGVLIDSVSDAQSLTVNAVGAETTTSLTSISPLSSTAGTAVTISGTVVAAAGTATPTGTVEIREGGPTGTLLASTTTIGGSGANGTFSIVSSAIPIGAYSSVRAYFKTASETAFLNSQSDVFAGGTLTVTAAAFTPGNLLVLRVGDGATPIVNGTSGNVTGKVTLLEFTPSGTLVQSIEVASAGAAAATLRLNSTSEGALSLSADRQTVTYGGFRVDAGPTNPNTGSTGRVIAKIGPGAGVDTTQAITGVFVDNSFRSAVTDNGTNFWLSGTGTNGGIQYVNGSSATTATLLTSSSDNVRQVQILDGNLFTASGSGAPGRSVFQVGVGLPTTATATQTATFTPAASSQYHAYFFADLDATAGWRNTGFDTLYATDTTGSIAKFSYVVSGGVGTWNASGIVGFAAATNLSGFVSGSSVTLYATSTTQDSGSFVSLVDTTGYNADFSAVVPTSLATAGTNYAFRGVSFVPRTGVSTTTTITGISPTSAEQADSVTFTATVAAGSGSARPTGTVQFRSGAILLATATIADGADATTGLATVSLPMTEIPLGTYTVTAQYIPDGNPSLNPFNPGTSAAFGTPLVIQAPGVVTTTTLSEVTWTAKPSAAAYGDAITFAGRVVTADSSTPAGTVEIRNGGSSGTLLGSTSTFATDGSFTITTSTPIASGTYAGIAAYFVGATGFKNSSSTTSATTLEISSTTLAAGDIAFTGLQVTGTDERISFVLLKNVIAGTTLTITDNAWSGTALATSEGTSTITFTQAFSAGTQFNYDATRATGLKWQTGGSATGISDSTPVAPALGNSGDNVFAYQGGAPTTGSATNWIAAISSQAFLTTGASSTTVTYLPSALTLGDTAFSLNLTGTPSQNGWLNDLGTVTNTAAGIRGTVYTLANWSAGLDSTTVTPVVPSPTIFVLGSAATPTLGTTGTISALSTTYGTASSAQTVSVTGSNLSGDITATAPAGFQVSSDGTTFGETATFTQSGGAASGTLYVRLAATTAAGPWSGNVSLTSSGATGLNVAIPTSTVAKKTLTVTGDNASRLLDEANPTFTATITGFVNGETAAVVSGVADLSTAATGASPAGTYAITAASGTLAATNYDFSFVAGTLTVTDELVFDVADGQTVTYSTARSAALKYIKRGLGTLVLDAASSHTGQTTVEAGTLTVAHGNALAASVVRVQTGGTLRVNAALTMRTPTVTIAGGTLAASGVTLLVNATTGIGTFAITSGAVTGSPGLTVSGNGVVTLPTDRRQILDLSTLSIDQASGGKIDIGKGRINIAVGGTTEADLRADVIAGRNAGPFNGTSGIMTTGGVVGSAPNPAVGYRVLGTGAAIVAWAAIGDTNLDGQVNITDVNLINTGARFNKGAPATWAQGDFNYGNSVVLSDITAMNTANMFNKGSYLPTTPTSLASPGTTASGTQLSAEVWAAYAVSLETQQQTKKK